MYVKIGNFKKDEDRQVKIKYHPWDSWNLDETLAMIILPGLKQLRKTSQSYPTTLNSFKEWKSVLKEMEWSFKYIANGRQYDFSDNIEQKRKDIARCQKGLDLFSKYYLNLWD